MLWKKVPPGKTEVTLESSHVGRLEFALMNQRGQALKNGALRLEAVDLPDATFIWAAERDQADKRPRRDKSAMVDARGITKFSPISAGAYRVYAAEAFSGDEWQWNEPQQISLRAGETLQLRAQWNNGKIVWLDNPFPNRPD